MSAAAGAINRGASHFGHTRTWPSMARSSTEVTPIVLNGDRVAETRRLILNVHGWDGQNHQLIGRAAFIAAFIAANADRIMNSPRGNLTFNWDGPALRPELHESYPHINTEGK